MPEGSPDSAMAQKVAMSYVVPVDGNYSLSMDVWVEKRRYQDIQIQWQEAGGSWDNIAINSEPVTEGTWMHVSTPGTGYLTMPGNTLFYLLVANVIKDGNNIPILDDQGNMTLVDGIKDAVLYIRDLELTVNGETLISCPSKVVQ